MTTTTISTTANAIAILREWEEAQPGNIRTAIVEWTVDAFRHEPNATARDVLHHLETTDCGACHAPHGLIYNRDISPKLDLWRLEINEAVAEYHDATGENPRPRDGALTLEWFVWFAVEWTAQDAAAFLSNRMEG
jgi:cytochrome c553